MGGCSRFLRRGWPAAVALALAFSTPAAAEDGLREALVAWEAGEWCEAQRLLRPHAQAGVPLAETLLGVAALRGLGSPPRPAEGAAWLWRAAARGYPPAQLALAQSFAQGHGVARDSGRALALARRAEAAGQPGAHELVRRLEEAHRLAARPRPSP